MNIKDNIGKIIGTGIVLTAAGFGAYKILGNKKIREYSDEWFKSLSDSALDKHREEARFNMLRPGNDLHEAVRWESIMGQFDKEILKRLNEKFKREYPNAVTVPRSNGCYLESDD